MESGAPSETSTATPTPAANPAGAAGSTPNAAPATAPTPAPASATPAAAAAPHAAPVERTPTRKLLTADDDTIPEDAETFEIGKAAFKKRLERFSRTQLKQMFGTDSPEEILAWKQQNEQFKAQEEAARLAQMTEAERYKVQHEKAAAEAAHWRQQYESLQESYTIREQDQRMLSIGQKYVDPDCMDYVMLQFAQHVQTVDEAEIGDPAAYADKWIAGYIEKHPKFGVAPPAPVAAPVPPAAAPAGAAPRQVQMPITNGVSTGRPTNAVPSGTLAQKTFAPGQPNSMTDDEAKREARRMGYSW